MTTIEKIFKNLDLTRKNYLIYDYVVKNGPIAASKIAEYLNMPRATVYVQLEKLLKLGLISTTGSYRKRKFIAEDPKQIVDLLEAKANKLKRLIPEAQELAQKITDNLFLRKQAIPEVKYFIGKEGARKVIEATLNCKSKEILGIVAIYNIYEILGEKFTREYTEKRIKKGIRVKNIWPIGEIPSFLSKHKEQLRNVRFSEEQTKFNSSFLTYDDIVIILTSREELLSVQIRSYDLVQAIKSLFELLWEKASPENRGF